MRKVIAAMNITIDGFCDHTAGIPDEEIHQHYANLLEQGDVILYGRKTFELMEYWRGVLENPTDDKAMIDFAKAIDKIPKIVFSHTMKSTDWKSASLATHDLKEEVLHLKNQPGGDILVGSPGLISDLTQLQLIDEFQLCVHPVIVGSGMQLFKDVKEQTIFKLIDTRVFKGGAIILYYEKGQG